MHIPSRRARILVPHEPLHQMEVVRRLVGRAAEGMPQVVGYSGFKVARYPAGAAVDTVRGVGDPEDRAVYGEARVCGCNHLGSRPEARERGPESLTMLAGTTIRQLRNAPRPVRSHRRSEPARPINIATVGS